MTNKIEQVFYEKLVNKVEQYFTNGNDMVDPYSFYILEDKENGEILWVMAFANDENMYNYLDKTPVEGKIDNCNLFIKNNDGDTIEISDKPESFTATMFKLENKEEVKQYLDERYNVKAIYENNGADIFSLKKGNLKNMTVIELDYTDEFNAKTEEGRNELEDYTDNSIRILEKLKCMFDIIG